MIRTPEGRWVKENPAVTERIETSINVYKVAIHRASILSTLKGHPGWDCVQEILGERLKSVNNKLAKFRDQDTRINDLLLQERADLELLLNLVDDFANSVSGFESALARSEKELETRRSVGTGAS